MGRLVGGEFGTGLEEMVKGPLFAPRLGVWIRYRHGEPAQFEFGGVGFGPEKTLEEVAVLIANVVRDNYVGEVSAHRYSYICASVSHAWFNAVTNHGVRILGSRPYISVEPMYTGDVRPPGTLGTRRVKTRHVITEEWLKKYAKDMKRARKGEGLRKYPVGTPCSGSFMVTEAKFVESFNTGVPLGPAPDVMVNFLDYVKKAKRFDE